VSGRPWPLPEGWVWASLSDICLVNPGHGRFSISDEDQVSFVPMSAIDEITGTIARPEVRKFREVRRGYTRFVEGDVLFAKITPCMENGKIAIARNLVNGIGCGTTELHVLRPLGGIAPEYISYYIRQKSFRRLAKANMTGTVGQQRVPAEFVRDANIPVCPVTEQRRMVSRIEEVLPRNLVARDSLAHVQGILKPLRKSILAKAFCGGLAVSDPHDEPAEQFIERIGQERRRRWAESLRAAGKDTGKHEYPEPSLPDTIQVPALPRGWIWTNLDALLSDSRYGTSQRCTTKAIGIPVLRIPNIIKGILDLKDLRYSQFGNEEIGRLEVQAGDLLVCRTNGSLGLVGKSAVVGNLSRAFVFASYLIRLRPVISEFMPHYLSLFLASPTGRRRIEKEARTTAGQYNISIPALKSIPVPLAPFEEMKRIIEKVREQLERAEQIQTATEVAQHCADNLGESILARAFRGRLVPQDIGDEPASFLLEKIRAERATIQEKG